MTNFPLFFRFFFSSDIIESWSRCCVVWFRDRNHSLRRFIERFHLFLLNFFYFNFCFPSSAFCVHNFINKFITFDLSLGSSFRSLCFAIVKFDSNHVVAARIFKGGLFFLLGFGSLQVKFLLPNKLHPNLWAVLGISSWRNKATALQSAILSFINLWIWWLLVRIWLPTAYIQIWTHCFSVFSSGSILGRWTFLAYWMRNAADPWFGR